MEVPASAFESLFDEYRSGLNSDLRREMQEKGQKMAGLSSEGTPLVEVLSDLILRGGKRLRPALVHFGYRACGGANLEDVRSLEIGTELLHTYLLIHDDIMDNADVRRGAPATHTHFKNEHLRNDWGGDASHYGSSFAILVGNLAHAQAHEQFTAAYRAAPDASAVRELVARMEEEVIEGQRLEMRLAQQRNSDPERLQHVLQLKSGRYSVQRPLQLGALFAGASEDQLETFAKYGSAAGGAFQLEDDILGMFGDPDATGKPVGDDLREGKMTFLIYHTLEQTDSGNAEIVLEALGDESISDEDVEHVCNIMHRSGAVDRVREMIDERLAQARRVLRDMTLEADAETFLHGFIDYLGERNR